MADINLLEFLSSNEIDKVVQQGDISIVNGGPTGTSYAVSDRIVETSVANNYKKKCLVRFRWSVDGDDFNSSDSVLEYAFVVDTTAWGGPVSDPMPGTLGAVAVGVSADNILFRVLNGHHSNVAYTGSAMSPGPDSFVGYSHTYRIQYAVLELE
jgi:hypothetical protein